jgi:hypothetical protein
MDQTSRRTLSSASLQTLVRLALHQANYNTPERKEMLETMRRRERRMLRRAANFITTAVDEDPYLDIYFEWTHSCSGWQQQPMIQLEENLKQRSIPWESCRIDGCNY